MKTGGAPGLVSSGAIKRPSKGFTPKTQIAVRGLAGNTPLRGLVAVDVVHVDGSTTLHVREDVVLLAEVQKLEDGHRFTTPTLAGLIH